MIVNVAKEREGQLEMKLLLSESISRYLFMNNHIMRGPLCRALGLINLLQHERDEERKGEILIKLIDEVKQIDVATKVISKSIEQISMNVDP